MTGNSSSFHTLSEGPGKVAIIDIGSNTVRLVVYDAPVRPLLDPGQQAWVNVVGLALRLAHTLSGSAPGLLSRTQLSVGSSKLTLSVPAEGNIFISDTVERRFKTLAKSIGLKAEID